MITISPDIVFLVIPFVVVVLIIILILRLRGYVKRAIRNEIYQHFPTIKNKIEEYERSLHNFKLEVEELRRKLAEAKK